MGSKRGIAAMSPESAELLWQDINDYGAIAVGLGRDAVRRELGIGSNRADRLYEWVNAYGAQDPRGFKVPRDLKARPVGGATHLIIPDTHAEPGQDLRRFEWIGRMISDIKPTAVISLGDWYSFDSLCLPATLADRVEKNTQDELRTGEIALALLESNITDKWHGEKHFCIGNHDDRLQRMAESQPWLDGLFNVGYAHESHGWNVHPFLEPVRVDGVRYQHYLTGKGNPRAIAGKFHALRLLERVKFAESVVVGHSHMWQHWSESSGHRRVHAVVAGCMMEHIEEYASEDDNEAWWRGCTVLRNVVDGDFDIETWSIDRIKQRWG